MATQLVVEPFHDESLEDLEKRLRSFGKVNTVKRLQSPPRVLIIYATPEVAQLAKEELEKEQHSTSKLQSQSLMVPKLKRAFLLSPPPSPPKDWAPTHEDICRTPFVDIQPEGNSLIPATPSHPSIVLDESQLLASLKKAFPNAT